MLLGLVEFKRGILLLSYAILLSKFMPKCSSGDGQDGSDTFNLCFEEHNTSYDVQTIEHIWSKFMSKFQTNLSE